LFWNATPYTDWYCQTGTIRKHLKLIFFTSAVWNILLRIRIATWFCSQLRFRNRLSTPVDSACNVKYHKLVWPPTAFTNIITITHTNCLIKSYLHQLNPTVLQHHLLLIQKISGTNWQNATRTAMYDWWEQLFG